MPGRPRPPPGRTTGACSGSGFSIVISTFSSSTAILRPTRELPPYRRALLSPSCTMRYASRDTAAARTAGSPVTVQSTFTPQCASSPSSPSRVGPVAPWSSPSLNRPSTASSSPTVRRVVSSIAVSASRTNSTSVSSTLRAAPACSVTALSAWPTESCSSRASRLRTARSAARFSAAASRSVGEGPSSTGAVRASSSPAAAAQSASAHSIARPAGGASNARHPSKT